MRLTLIVAGPVAALALAGSSLAPLAATAAGSSAGSAATPRCHIGQLSVHHGRVDGAAGTIGTAIVFRNVSSRTCELTGYPGGLRLNRHRHAMQTTVVRGGSTIYTDPGPNRVVLRPGHRASFGLAWSDVSTGNTACKTSTFLEVTPPNAFHHRTIRLTIDACDHGALNATAVQKGSSPAH
jgi:hypothetical protein